MSKPKIYPLVYLFAALLAMFGLHWAAPLYRWAPWPWNLAGLVPLAAGVGVICWVAALFRRQRTTINPFASSSALVIQGPFLLSRNPIYLGKIAALIGIAVLLGSASPLLVVPVFLAVLDRRFIQAEERMLETAFGDEYRAYKDRVRRWI